MTKSQTKKNASDIEKLLASHQEHLLIANEEMGVVKNDIAWIKKQIGCFEQRFDKLDNRVWAIIGTTVLGTLLSIAINLYFK